MLRGFRVFSAVVSVCLLSLVPIGTTAATAATGDPTLVLNRLIETAPFVGSSVSVRDNEGSAYVAADNSLWIVSDNDSAAFEIDPDTGALRRTIAQSAFATAQQYGGGPVAGNIRSDDFESAAYDATADELFVFSGSSTAQPTVFRLRRDGSGQFQVDSWQPLANSASYTASGWRSTDGKLYVVQSRTFASYDYATNTVGPGFEVAGIRPYGIDFAEDGDLLAVTTSERLVRADFETREIRPGWNLDLTPFDVRDSRAVEVIGNQLFVSDGYDSRASNDPKEHAVFVFDVSYGFEPVAPTASFTSSTSSGAAPLTVTFTDTSAGTPGTASWDFGDGLVSTVSNPSHVFTSAGDFTVTLTVTNDAGTDSASSVISVTAPALTTIVTPSADSYTSSSSANRNYGDRTELKLLDSSTEYRPFLSFDVQGLSGAPQSATLRLFVTNGSSSGGAWYSVTEPWSENTIT
ncbi:MAG: PKD domain-containing protein, partial [Acidimicrobiia bacterium]|nr:PKD domain-containing protein [Acidimicrobiia bacterium]